MYLRQVKNAIFDTECGRLVRDGMCCSEPILSRDAKGVIDNFFVYCEDWEEGTFSGPAYRFGIYAETRETAYMEKNERYFSVGKDVYQSYFRKSILAQEKYEKYSLSYARVREFVLMECTEEQRDILKGYMQSLEEIIDAKMLPLYWELAPRFFTWAYEKIGHGMD